MKKLLLTFAIVLLFTSLTSAQNFKGGVGAAYGTDISSIGLSANAVYKFNDKWGASGSFIFFFEKDLVSWKAINVNANYTLSKKDGLELYGLGGINLTMYTVEIPSFSFMGMSTGGGESTGSNFGINIGGGARKEFNESMELFGESYYTLGDANYLTLNVGVLFKF